MQYTAGHLTVNDASFLQQLLVIDRLPPAARRAIFTTTNTCLPLQRLNVPHCSSEPPPTKYLTSRSDPPYIMSISTCSLNSHSGSSGMASKPTPVKAKSQGSHVLTREDIKRDSPVCQKGWAGELQARVLQYPRHAPAFIDELMPCSVPFPDTKSKDALDKVFAEYSPEKGKELNGYNGLVCIL